MSTTYLNQPTYARGTNLAGQTVQTPQGAYVMRGASSGVPSLPYLRQASQGGNFQQTSYTPIQNRPTTPAELQAAQTEAARQMSLAQANYGRNAPAGVQIQKVSSGFTDNGNPALRGGIGQVAANGQTFRIPNALLQQMMFTDSYNQGRSNEVGEFFAGQRNTDPKLYTNANYDVTQQRFDKIMKDNPSWTDDAPLNPYMAAKEKATAASNRYQNLMGQMTNQVQKETANNRGITGGTMGGLKSQADAALAEAQSYAPELNARRASYFGDLAGTRKLEAQQKAFQGGVKATYSNLPIRETLIR